MAERLKVPLPPEAAKCEPKSSSEAERSCAALGLVTPEQNAVRIISFFHGERDARLVALNQKSASSRSFGGGALG